MAEPIIYLRDLQGPFTGHERPYLKSAAENAIATGYAERLDAEPEVDASPAAPEVQVPQETAPPSVRIVGTSPGWYDVEVDGVAVNEKSLRKDAAEDLAAGLGGEKEG